MSGKVKGRTWRTRQTAFTLVQGLRQQALSRIWGLLWLDWGYCLGNGQKWGWEGRKRPAHKGPITWGLGLGSKGSDEESDDVDSLHHVSGASLSIQRLAEEMTAVGASVSLLLGGQQDHQKEAGKRSSALSRQTSCSSSLLPSLSLELLPSADALLWWRAHEDVKSSSDATFWWGLEPSDY